MLSHATASNAKMSSHGKPSGPEVSRLYYIGDKRVLCTDSQNWTCNINFLRNLNKSKLEHAKLICLSSDPCKAQADAVEIVESGIFQIWLIFHVWLPFDEKVTQAIYYRCLSNRCHGNQANKFWTKISVLLVEKSFFSTYFKQMSTPWHLIHKIMIWCIEQTLKLK